MRLLLPLITHFTQYEQKNSRCDNNWKCGQNLATAIFRPKERILLLLCVWLMGVWNISHGALPPLPATGPSRAPHPRSINPCQGRWRARNGSFPGSERKESILIIKCLSKYENVAQKKVQTKMLQQRELNDTRRDRCRRERDRCAPKKEKRIALLLLFARTPAKVNILVHHHHQGHKEIPSAI